jgi:Leucine-rich repeat (LRR) protein
MVRMIVLLIALLSPTDFDVAAWVTDHGGQVVADRDAGITGVNLRASWITDGDLEVIGRLPHLRTLDLSLTQITDLGIERLKTLKEVSQLNLYHAEHITDTAIGHLREWRRLERLNLRGTDVTDTTLEYVASFTNLKALDVSFTQVTNNGIEHLAPLVELQEIALGGNKVTGAGLHVLRVLPKLTKLSLNGTQKRNSGYWSVSLTDFDLDVITAFVRLEELDLGGTKITDPGLGKLKSLPGLRVLDLSRTQISGKGIEQLAALPNLERLNLWQAKRIDDAAAAQLAALPRLAILDLAGTAISDLGLERLSELKSLRKLFVGGTRVTAAGVEAFKRAHPACEVSAQIQSQDGKQY